MSEPKSLTLMVSDLSRLDAEPERREKDAEGEQVEAYGVGKEIVRRITGRRPKDVDLARVKDDLDRVQDQIDSLLESVKARDTDSFRLTEVEVSLAISAEGSIGVATAGVEASIALTFGRRGARDG